MYTKGYNYKVKKIYENKLIDSFKILLILKRDHLPKVTFPKKCMKIGHGQDMLGYTYNKNANELRKRMQTKLK